MDFWWSESRIEELIEDHLEHVEKVFVKFGEGIKVWMDHEDIDEAGELTHKVRNLERRADEVRREIEKELIGGALLANSRGRIMDLVGRVDKLANAGEATMNFTVLQEIRVPDQLKPLVIEIVDRTLEIIDHVRDGVLDLLEGKVDEALEATKAIEIGESNIDELEQDFIGQLFTMDLDLAEKILLRQFLETLVETSDRAEDFSDRLDMILAIRRT